MSSWPVELFSYVFELACTDGGHTAQVLSLTCTQFREISRPFLYQSLVLSTPTQLTTLLERAEQVPPHLRRIKHLFLALNHNSHSDPNGNTCSDEVPLIIKTLHLASPTLQSLCFIPCCPQSSTSLLSYLFRIPFPHLEELTLAGLYSYSFRPLNFPRLQRLHFAGGNRNPFGLFQFGGLDRAFPGLTHLKIGGLSRAGAFVDELEHALRSVRRLKDNDNNSGQSDNVSETTPVPSLFDSTPIALPARLEKVYVHCATPSPAMSRSSSRSSSISDFTTEVPLPPLNLTDARQRTMMDRLTNLEEEFGVGRLRRTPIQLVVTTAEGSQNIKSAGTLEGVASQLKHDWLDRLDGGDGAWSH